MKTTRIRLLKVFTCWMLMFISAVTATFAGQRDLVSLVWSAVLLYATGGLIFVCAVEYFFSLSKPPLTLAGSLGAVLFLLLLAQIPTGTFGFSSASDTALSALAVLTYTMVWGVIAEFLVELARWRWAKK